MIVNEETSADGGKFEGSGTIEVNGNVFKYIIIQTFTYDSPALSVSRMNTGFPKIPVVNCCLMRIYH